MRVLLTPRVMFPDYPAVLAVVFDIEPGWHLYWKNSGDTGMPIRLTFTLPEGLRTGEIYWPGPKRCPQPGDLWTTSTKTRSSFRAIVGTGPARADRVGVKAEWLVCKEACLPGEASVSLTITPDSKVTLEDEKALDRFLSRLPFPMTGRAQLSWDGTTLVIDSPQATGMVFYPEFDRNARPVNMLRDGESPGGALKIAYHDSVRQAERVRGVLEIRNNIGRSAFYEVDIAPPR